MYEFLLRWMKHDDVELSVVPTLCAPADLDVTANKVVVKLVPFRHELFEKFATDIPHK